ncbi:hypothetical protein [Paenibacillus sp. GXUN7292]|uniref:hypothetical protein n=1 Tax=Paenibacillus sp. GXUN7292 TaxID=3422499 RepID=UPI003D7D7E35
MRKVGYISVFFITILMISGCSSTKELFIGNWSALQASQKEGANEELSHYNYWEVRDKEISFSNYYLTKENGIETKKFNNENRKKYEYTWDSKAEIVINKKVYKVEISKNKLTISNNNMEILFEKVD